MHVLFVVLNETEYLEDILAEFIKIGISGATILDSQGMGRALVNSNGKVPFLGSLRTLLEGSRPFNKTIFTVIDNEDLLDKAMQSVDQVVGGFDKVGVGLMFAVPVGKIHGYPKK